MKIYILYLSIYFVFYILGAYATTDILRLLKGSSTPVNASKCYCPICHNKISLKDQLPIFSYIKNHGKCFHCQNPIPISDLFLEVFIFLTFSVLCTLLHFSPLSFFLCVIIYELTKLIFLIFHGIRKNKFLKNLFISIINNIFLFSLISILFLLIHIM